MFPRYVWRLAKGMGELQPFKNYYNEGMAWRLAGMVAQVYPAFDGEGFVAQVRPQLPPLELKERVAVFSQALHDHLPADYPQAVEILLAILGPALNEEEGMFNDGWYMMPLAHFVEVHGLEHFEVSVRAMKEITQRHSSEFTIRPFLVRYPDEMLAVLHEWAHDESFHVRRLVSEGTRPRLPWGMRLHQFVKDPTPTLALLEHLKDDPSEYVRRSVANHLNDITKDHPDLVLMTLRRWQVGASPERLWLIRHALRSLVKAGHPQALALLGYGEVSVSLVDFRLEPAEVKLGEGVTFTFTLRNDAAAPQDLLIDYLVHYVKANGSTSPKVFKLTTRTLAPGETVTIEKKHALRPVTTRVHYPGQHTIEVQVNGQIVGGKGFELVTGDKEIE